MWHDFLSLIESQVIINYILAQIQLPSIDNRNHLIKILTIQFIRQIRNDLLLIPFGNILFAGQTGDMWEFFNDFRVVSFCFSFAEVPMEKGPNELPITFVNRFLKLWVLEGTDSFLNFNQGSGFGPLPIHDDGFLR